MTLAEFIIHISQNYHAEIADGEVKLVENDKH